MTTTVVREANRLAIERVLASEPWLVGVRPAREVVPGLALNMILHAAPPTRWDEMAELLQGGMIGFGLTSPPMACFEQAAEAFRARYG